MTETSCELVGKISSLEVPQQETGKPIQSEPSKVLLKTKNTPTSKPSENCQNKICLLAGTPRVGVFQLEPKSLDESLIGRGEQGQTFKFGKGRVTEGNVNAARNLLSREFPQVNKSFCTLKLKASTILCFR